MIAELFYPKELKDIIADLRAKDDLNEEALRQIKGNALLFFLIGAVVIPPVYYFKGYDHTQVALGIFFLLGYVWTVRHSSKMMAIPYTLGRVVLGKIEWITFGKNGNPSQLKGWHFIYSFENSKKDKVKKRFFVMPEYMVSPAPQKGDDIEIYVHPENEKFHAPFIPKTFEKLCLSKKRTQEILETKNSENQSQNL